MKSPKKKYTKMTDNLFDKQQPASKEAEQSVIGALLLDPELCDEVALILRPEDFYYDANRRIYQAVMALWNESAGVDLTILIERLRKRGELNDIGGELYLADVMKTVQVIGHVHRYAEIVREHADRRELIKACSKILQAAYNPNTDKRQLVSQAEEKIFAVSNARSNSSVNSVTDIIQDVYQLLDDRTTGNLNGIKTGFYELDNLLGGLHGSELIILAARPSMGKTALATNIADYVAVEQRKPVLFFSLEMSKVELVLRMICARGKIKGDLLRDNNRSEQTTRKFTAATNKLSGAPLFIDDSPSRTVSEIAATARRIKRQQGLGLIVIDYLGLITPDSNREPRQEQVAKIARRLKGLARELDTPVLCLAQLNRMAEATKDNKPRLSHLRESGAIEQDADVVMFVHREEYYLSHEKAEEAGLLGVAEIIIAKQRNGPTGTVKLAWQNQYTLFSNYATSDGQENYSEFQDDFSFGSEYKDF